jgi:hypothetical protein
MGLFRYKIIICTLFFGLFIGRLNAQNLDSVPINCSLSWHSGWDTVVVTLGRVKGKLNEDDLSDWGRPFSEGLVDNGDMLRTVTPDTIVGQASVRVSVEANELAIFDASPIIFIRNGTSIEVDQRFFTISSPITNLDEFADFMKSNPDPACEIR